MDSFINLLSELPTLLVRLEVQLEANTRALEHANELIGNTRMYEEDAAKYLNVQKYTMYRYRERGLPYEKNGNVISYRRKDLDEWRANNRTQHGTSSVY